jgi:tRNA-specific 2-thiouridylase
MKRVVVGLSGGVDSSVAAYLLQQQGYEVIGLFMRNWVDDTVTLHNECPWIEDSNDAMMVAEKLGIPFQVIDLSEQYKERIVDYMFAEYKAGRTPNPDVLCNREIKFDIFLDTAMKLGVDYVATGHYCRKGELEVAGKKVYRLLAGVDQAKDQSYFLCQLNQFQLSKARFPIGELTKPQVRAIAHELNLVTANKKDSQGLCFIGKVSLPDFLQQQLKPQKGPIIEISAHAAIFKRELALAGAEHEQPDFKLLSTPYVYEPEMGKKVGEHNGAHFFTNGQRKGLQVGGSPKPLFVIATDVKSNTIYVGQGDDHPGLYRNALFVKSDDEHWLRADLTVPIGGSEPFLARIRYRQPLQEATLYKSEDGLYIAFSKPQRAIAPGQFVAWYSGDELVGSGVISA